jgi:hypothetical protein
MESQLVVDIYSKSFRMIIFANGDSTLQKSEFTDGNQESMIFENDHPLTAAAHTMLRFFEISGEESSTATCSMKPNRWLITEWKGRKVIRPSVSNRIWAPGQRLFGAFSSAQVCSSIILLFRNIIHTYSDFPIFIRRLKTNIFGILFAYVWHLVSAFSIHSDQFPRISIMSLPSHSRRLRNSLLNKNELLNENRSKVQSETCLRNKSIEFPPMHAFMSRGDEYQAISQHENFLIDIRMRWKTDLHASFSDEHYLPSWRKAGKQENGTD